MDSIRWPTYYKILSRQPEKISLTVEKLVLTVKKDFSGNSLFQKGLKDAFVEIVNKNVGQYTNAELMSTFCDRILKSGGEKLSESEVELNLEKNCSAVFLSDRQRHVC